MRFDLSDEQRLFRDQVAAFARRHLADGALARAKDPRFPFDVAVRMAEAGLLGITIPAADDTDEEAGGRLMMAVIAIEQVALVCPRSADVVQAGNFGAARTLAEFGTDEQKRRFLDPVLEGKAGLPPSEWSDDYVRIGLGRSGSWAGSGAVLRRLSGSFARRRF